MAPDPDDLAPAGGPPAEEEQQEGEGHVIARRRPDGKRIDEVGDPAPIDKHPHHGS